LPFPNYGVLAPEEICENIGATRYNVVVHFGDKIHAHVKQLGVKFTFREINLMAPGHQKWDEKSTLCRPTFKSGTKFTVPVV